ncbi:MAG: beta-CASP ribonuclease aCPSF1 [Candidatus Bathyarchaeia archaeon]
MVLNTKIRQHILENLPREAEITRIEYEGPRIAIYTTNPEAFVEQSFVIADIVKLIKKRIVIRSDPSVRLDQDKARELILETVPDEAGIENISFDSAFGDVIIEAKKVGLVVGRNGRFLQEIVKKTKWKPKILREPPLPSKTISSMRKFICDKGNERSETLRRIGERVFRPLTFGSEFVRLTALGGFRQVGRSSILVQTPESTVLLDCGINLGSRRSIETYPRLDDKEFDISALDAVVLSHAHLDHCGFVPFLYKYGYDGPVYCSEPTSSLTTLLQLDYLDVLKKEGLPQPYSEREVKRTLLHTITVNYGEVNDIAPDIRLTLHNAGHTLGSSIIHLHVGEGLYNIVYTGDFKSSRTELLEPATSSFPRSETLIIESTYGAPDDVLPSRSEAEKRLVDIINHTVGMNGKVLIPVLAVGRAQEIMLVLEKAIREGSLVEIPIFIEGMVAEATAIHTGFPGWLSRPIRDRILVQGENPFESEYFTVVKHSSDREQVIYGGPCVIMATNGMLVGGPALDYFRQLAPGKENTIIFVSYQVEGTLGHRVQHGLTEVPMVDEEGKMRMTRVESGIASFKAFSGHSDRKEIVRYVGRMTPRPKRILVCHGEKSKAVNLAHSLHRIYGIGTNTPSNLETLRLR